MNNGIPVNAVRIAEEVMTDGSCVYGVDLLNAIWDGKRWDIAEDFAHIACENEDFAEQVINGLTNFTDVEELDRVSRPHC